MHTKSLPLVLVAGLIAPAALAIDAFNINVVRALNEETSQFHEVDIVTVPNGLGDTGCRWLHEPGASFRFDTVQQSRTPRGSVRSFDSERYSPGLSADFESYLVHIGLSYSRTFVDDTARVLSPAGLQRWQMDGDGDSFGAYAAHQFDNGLRAGLSWAYTSADYKGHRFGHLDFETTGAAGSVGFAHSFGDKNSSRNLFVDTSANLLFQSEEDAWYFLWLARFGHNITDRFAIYGLFNLYHEIDHGDDFSIPVGYAGYHPYGDDIWAETGGGVKVEVIRGLSLMAEATLPIFDDHANAQDAFQVRAAVNWRF